MKKIYLAGPDVFRKNAKAFLDHYKAYVKSHRLTGLSPLDPAYPPTVDLNKIAAQIYHGNIKLLDKCDAVVANITPFRGAGMDPGTSFEIGYAIAQGKLVFAYTDSPMTYRERHEDLLRHLGLKSITYPVVEDFGLKENLMIAIGVNSIANSFQGAVWNAVVHFANAKKKAA